MLIVADENIPLLDEFFADIGTLVRLPGRLISANDVQQADVLLVRSVTLVNRQLLEGSCVRFVGTCTIGTDHLDQAYLNQAGIAWSSAPGCNARGVVDYVLSSLLVLAERSGQALARRCYGVVGAGQVGGRLVQVLRALGWRVLVCDPPLAAQHEADFVGLEQIIEHCDVISLHTPLDASTRHLFDHSRLMALREGVWLINASRGAVVDNLALLEVLSARADLRAVLDVWEHEPEANVALAARCDIATPHIAGYSLDGKLRGTAQIYAACCVALGLEPRRQLASLLPQQWLAQISIDAKAEPQWLLSTLCRSVYDLRGDDAAFRLTLQGDTQLRRQGFDRLRKEYPPRRELEGLTVELQGHAPHLQALILALGAQPQMKD